MTNQKNRFFSIVLGISLFTYFLILMDNSIIFTSSVEIGRELRLNAVDLAWISNAYTLTFGGFLLLSGRLSDILGRKTIFLTGLYIFGISSLLIGLTPNASVMIIARAIQGIGSAILAPSSLALIMDSYTGTQRARAISYYGATAGIGSSLGLLLGGFLTSYISWRAGFLINVPFTVILILLAKKHLSSPQSLKKEKIDYIGSLLSVVGLISLIYGLSHYQGMFLAIGSACLLGFICYERRINFPILPLSLFAHRIRSSAYAIRLLFMMTMLPYWFLLPQLLQHLYHFTALQAGFAFLPLSLTTFIAAMKLPKLSRRFTTRQLIGIGEILLLIGFIWSALASLSYGYLGAIFLPMLLIGSGQALIMAPVTSAGIYQAPDTLAGSASGLTNTMHQLGGPIGLSLLSAVGAMDYSKSLWWLCLFTVLSLAIVLFAMIQPTEPTRGGRYE